MIIIIYGVHVKGRHHWQPSKCSAPIKWTKDDDDDCELDEAYDHFVDDDDHVKSSSKEVII